MTKGCWVGQLLGNQLAEGLAEINAFLPPYCSIHGLPDRSGTIANFRFGRNYQDFLSACAEYDASLLIH